MRTVWLCTTPVTAGVRIDVMNTCMEGVLIKMQAAGFSRGF